MVPVNLIVPNPNPVLSVVPSSLTFAPAVVEQMLSISNAAGGTLDWRITADQAWLSPSPDSGLGGADVTVGVDRTGLADGIYSGNLLVTSNGGSANVPVQLQVGFPPLLNVNPSVLVFTDADTTNIFSISNGGGGVLNWTLTADDAWIEVVPPLSGTGDAVVTVNVDPDDVPSGGPQTGGITVNSNGGTQIVEVRFVPDGPSLSGRIGVYADEYGGDCNLVEDGGTEVLMVHVVHVNTNGVTGSQFAAPMPSCMTGVTWVGDQLGHDLTIGNSQSGVAVVYGACLAAPIRVISIAYIGGGLSETCCRYPVIPHPQAHSGEIEVTDCVNNLLIGNGGEGVVNPDNTCTCGTVLVEECTWGRIKALYSTD